MNILTTYVRMKLFKRQCLIDQILFCLFYIFMYFPLNSPFCLYVDVVWNSLTIYREIVSGICIVHFAHTHLVLYALFEGNNLVLWHDWISTHRLSTSYTHYMPLTSSDGFCCKRKKTFLQYWQSLKHICIRRKLKVNSISPIFEGVSKCLPKHLDAGDYREN